MTEENRGLREAEVEKRRVKLFFSQIKLISNAECKKKLAGIYKIYPSHICGFTPGSLSFSSLLFSLRLSATHLLKVWTLVMGTQEGLLLF